MFHKFVAQFGCCKVGVLGAVFMSACAVQASTLTPIEGERLSDWMLRQPSSNLSYSTGLQWQVPTEREAQAKLDGVHAGIEASAKLGENRQWSVGLRAHEIRALSAEAIAKGEG